MSEFFSAFLEEHPVAERAASKISQPAPSAPQSSVPPPSAYINVACNPGFHSDDEDGVFEEGIL